MELWIRSQSKKLLEKAETIKIAKYEEDDSYSIVVNNDYVFGEYQTEARALEILNEIQSILDFNDIRGIVVNANRINSYVYEMPEE